jgi:hypothetical protein
MWPPPSQCPGGAIRSQVVCDSDARPGATDLLSARVWQPPQTRLSVPCTNSEAPMALLSDYQWTHRIWGYGRPVGHATESKVSIVQSIMTVMQALAKRSREARAPRRAPAKQVSELK